MNRKKRKKWKRKETRKKIYQWIVQWTVISTICHRITKTLHWDKIYQCSLYFQVQCTKMTATPLIQVREWMIDRYRYVIKACLSTKLSTKAQKLINRTLFTFTQNDSNESSSPQKIPNECFESLFNCFFLSFALCSKLHHINCFCF